MQRTVEIADFELPRGAVAISELMVMDRPGWEHLRAEINLRHRADPDRPLARCRLCRAGVYIKAQATGSSHSPLFAHYAGSPSDCPWYQGANLVPDDARAAQYRGHQECALHRSLCDTIAEFLERDPRCTHVAVDRYLKPHIEERGRYPDVYVELGEAGKFAFEVQLAKPFAFEIAARHLHYRAEGVALVWVFRELAADLPQGFHDVIAFQRGNAFLFDQAAFAASNARGQLTLSAWLEDGRGGWLKPRLVGLDDLDRGNGRSVFVEDRRTPRLLARGQEVREKWWRAFKTGKPFDFSDPNVEQGFGPAWDSIKEYVPALSGWKNDYWRIHNARGRPHFLELVAMLFSIARSAAAGEERVYISRYRDKSRLVAMLNARLSNSSYKSYADLIEAMLGGSAMAHCLERPSLRASLADARRDTAQVAPGHPVWAAANRLFPEIYDGLLRAELSDLGHLPRWAIPLPAPRAETG